MSVPALLNTSSRSSPDVPPRRQAMRMVAAAVLSLSQLPACAAVSQPRERPQQHLVALSIIDRETGQPLIVHHKDDRSFVAGQPASRYAIRVSNRTAGRVLVVMSVDGVNIVSGENAAVGQTGYVLAPWRTFDIAGWRKSDREIAAFEFAALADSYAARTGRPGNVGVIGMAAFLERPAPPPVVSPLPSPPIEQDRLGANRLNAPPCAGTGENHCRTCCAGSGDRCQCRPRGDRDRQLVGDGRAPVGSIRGQARHRAWPARRLSHTARRLRALEQRAAAGGRDCLRQLAESGARRRHRAGAASRSAARVSVRRRYARLRARPAAGAALNRR